MKGITLTREQEVALIEIGMNTLMRNLPAMMNHNKKPRKKKEAKAEATVNEKPEKKKRFMSKAARRKISRRMKAYWATQRNK